MVFLPSLILRCSKVLMPMHFVDAPGYSWPYTLSLAVTHSHGYHRLGVSENQANISPQFLASLFLGSSPTWPSYII